MPSDHAPAWARDDVCRFGFEARSGEPEVDLHMWIGVCGGEDGPAVEPSPAICLSCASPPSVKNPILSPLILSRGQRYIGSIIADKTMPNDSSPSKQPLADNGPGESHDDPEDGPRSRRAVRPPSRRLSQVLTDIAADKDRSEITVADLLRLMEGRARAALIFLFAFPNVLPAPPGLSAILGLPLLYLTSQMMLGHIPWLPKVIASRGVLQSSFSVSV